MHKTTIYLEESAYERISRLAEARGTTQAAIIREAIAVYAGGEKRAPSSIGLGRSKHGDLSDRAEELLEGFGRKP